MDRKSIIILIAAVLLLFGLPRIVDHFYPPALVPVAAAGTNQPAPANTASNTLLPAAPAPNLSASLEGPVAPEKILSVTNQFLIWHFTSRGGGLKDVQLREYPSVIRPGHTNFSTNLATLNHNAPLPILTVLGAGLQENNNFVLTESGGALRAEQTLTNGLRLVKTFEPGTNYLFKATVRFENTSSQPLSLPSRDIIIGTATAVGPLDDPNVLGTFWYNSVKLQNIQAKWFANRTLGCIPGVPRTQYEEGANNVVWAAVHNQFFALAAIPSEPAPEVRVDKIDVSAPDMSGPTNSLSALLTNGYQTALVYPPGVLASHQSVDLTFTFYAGPKEYNRLAQIAQKMGNNLDLIMNFTPPFGFFSKFLLLSMNALHDFGLPYGLAIIVITVIIKLIFWPLTNASTKSQKRLQALQPQIKAISDKYKDDPMKKNQKTMEFMKEHKVNPMGSCLPTLLQVPVFWGFYSMLRSAIELRGAHFLWAFDLSQPDTVAHLAGFPVNPLPLIMGATQLWQAQMMPPSPGMDPGQQKIMRYMPLMFIAIFYRMPAGLTLYWTVQNLLSILQIRLTKANEPSDVAALASPVRKKK